MDALQRAKWEQVRAKGCTRYVLVEGVLKQGTFYATGMVTLTYLWRHGFDLAGMSDHFASTETIIGYVFSCLFYGLFMGWLNWRFLENAYTG